MSVSHPAVHPVEAPPTPQTDGPPRRVRMRDFQGMPGTASGLLLRLFQLAFSAVAVSVMASTDDFPSVTAFRMRDFQGMISTVARLVLRLCQLAFAAMVVILMATPSDFPWFTAFCYLVAAAGLQSLWSLSLAIVDIYTLLVGHSLHNGRAIGLFAVGDGITSTLTFAAACACAGITVLIDNDFGTCNQNHCKQFETATAMAFLSWFASLPSFFLNFWSLACR